MLDDDALADAQRVISGDHDAGSSAGAIRGKRFERACRGAIVERLSLLASNRRGSRPRHQIAILHAGRFPRFKWWLNSAVNACAVNGTCECLRQLELFKIVLLQALPQPDVFDGRNLIQVNWTQLKATKF